MFQTQRPKPLIGFKRFVLVICVFFLGFGSLAYAQEPTDEKSKVEPASQPLKAKPLKLESSDGRLSMVFGFAAQMQYDATWSNVNEANASKTSFDHLFTFKRIQPSIKGHLFSKDLTYKFQIETIPGKITLMDLFLDYKANEQVRFRMGAHKPGFSRKRMNSWKNQQLVDFSNAPRYYGTERALGLTMHNGYGKKTEHEYEIGVYGGMPWRPNCAKGIATVSKRGMDNPSLLSDKSKPYNELHPEIIGHYAYNANGIDVSTETDWERRDFRYSLGIGFSYDFRPQPFRDPAARTAVEAMIKSHGFNFFGTFFTAFHDPKSGLATDIEPAFIGGFAQVGYLFPVPVEVALRYFGNMTMKDFRDSSKANATAQIAADAALASQYKGAGDLKSEHELAAGFNYYPFGRHVKLATDVSWIMKDYDSKDAQSDARWRMLMQFYF